MLEPRAPEGWFVRPQVAPNGDVTLTVMQMVGHQELKDREWVVVVELPQVDWFERFFWGITVDPFPVRLATAAQEAAERAVELNRRHIESRQLVYDILHPKKARPHESE